MKTPYMLFFVLIFFCLICGCDQHAPPKGTVAIVNGEPINLRSVQALLDSRSASLGIPPRPSLSELRKNYGHATSILIVSALVRQELASRGMDIKDSEVDNAIGQIKKEMGAENFDEYLTEATLREDEWRQFMRDHLELEVFINRILQPSLRVSLDEMRAYYDEHKADFDKPATWRVCYAVGENRKALEAWCDANQAEGFEDSPLAQCVNALPENVPAPWDAGLKKLKAPACGAIVEQDNEWRAMALIAKNPERIVPLSEVYPLVENILLESKKREAFSRWLENRLATSKIVAAPELFEFVGE